MPRLVLGSRPNVEQHDAALSEARDQLIHAQPLDLRTLTEIGVGEQLHAATCSTATSRTDVQSSSTPSLAEAVVHARTGAATLARGQPGRAPADAARYGKRWTWGTECSYRDTGHWDIWNSETLKWEPTDVPCPVVSANEWHHLAWTVERVSGQAHYISVELDGKVTQVDKYYNPQLNYRGDGVNIAFQMDGDYRQDPYSVWLDNVSLSSW